MFYVYIVLSNTIILTGIIYCLQILFEWWGPKLKVRRESRPLQKLNMGKPVSKEKKDCEDDCNDTKAESENKAEDDNKETKTEEKLTVQIITNKEPVIEKIDEDKNVVDDTNFNNRKLLRFCKLFQSRNRGNKIVNFDKTKWTGQVSCVINKNIQVWSQSSNSVKKGNFGTPLFFPL